MASLWGFLQDPISGRLVELAIIAILVGIAVFFARRAATRRLSEASVRRRVRKATTYAGFTLIALAAAFLFSSSLGNITVVLGFASAGIAFALQGVITNVAAWLINSTGSYYKIGDRIQMGGVAGDVVDANMMVTTLMEIGAWVNADLYTGRHVRVPNSALLSGPVYNYSADFPFLWDEITIPIKYGGDRQLARTLLTSAAREVTAEYTEQGKETWRAIAEKYAVEEVPLDPQVTMTANDNWLEFTVRYVTSYQRRRRTKDELFTKIMDQLDQVGNRLAIASGTYDIVGLPTLNVQPYSQPQNAVRASE